MIMNKQKALDCTTGLNRELKVEEKLLIQNDQHLQTHLKILEELLSLKKRIASLEEILPEICNSINEHENNEIIDPNTNI